jgi:C-terminal processing protease CtpA/Prc
MSHEIVSLSALAQQEGQALYRNIWLRLQNEFWDPSRLNWKDWEHRFDGDIVNVATARQKARELVAALGDSYSKLKEKVPSSTGDGGSDKPDIIPGIVGSTVIEDGNIGYLLIQSFSSLDVFEQVSTELAKIAHCDAFIIDLRGNAGGFVNQTARCLELFVEEGMIATLEEQHKDGVQKNHVYFEPDMFFKLVVRPDGKEESVPAERVACVTKGKRIVLLIDGGTCSSAELFAAALLEMGEASCIAMGSRTFGKGIIQSTVEFDGCALTYTSGRYLSPTEEWFGDGGQKVSNGIRPTIPVSTATSKLPLRTAANYLRQKLGKPVRLEQAESFPGEGLVMLGLGAAFLLSFGLASMWTRRD